MGAKEFCFKRFIFECVMNKIYLLSCCVVFSVVIPVSHCFAKKVKQVFYISNTRNNY